MRHFRKFHVGLLVILLVAFVLTLLASLANSDLSAVGLFLCVLILAVLPILVVIDVVWLVLLGLSALFSGETSLVSRLTDYMRHARAKGQQESDIRKVSRNNGWSDEEIEQAWSNSSSQEKLKDCGDRGRSW